LWFLAQAWSSGHALAQTANPPEVIHLPQQTGSAGSGTVARVQPSPRSAVNIQEVLAELWQRRRAYLEKNDLAAARKQVDLMRDVVRREGILSAEDMAGAFLSEGNRALEGGNRTRALESFHLASEFYPEEPAAYFGVARTLWSQERDLTGALSALVHAVRATLKNPVARSARIGNLLLVLMLGSATAATLWCILSALRTARLSQHDLYERRARGLSPAAAQIAAWALWLLPALLWLSGWWLLVYWLALSLPYQKRTERALSALACSCFLVALPVLGWVTHQSSVTTDPSVRFLLETARGGVDPERIPVLEQMASSHPSEPLFHFLLAQTYAATGSLEASLQEYRQVQSLQPNHAKAWINSGNLFYSRDQFSQAAQEYDKAVQSDPTSALAQYDLSLALQGSLRLEEADAAFQKARDLDNSLITSVLASEGGESRREPLEARYSGSEILEQLQKSGSRGREGDRVGAWITPLSLAGGAGLFACLVIPWMAPRWGFGRAQRCLKCGQPFCRRCQVGMKREEGYCTACRHLFVLKDPVAPKSREERERVVASHERWEWISRRLISLILPGAGQIRGGRTLLGVFLLWVACIAVAALLLTGRMLAYPGIPVLNSQSMLRVVSVTFVAGAWLAANTLSFQKRT
jgi:tetratricopeptide (TPR) repeat protein